jgi:hypothetical protein
MKDLEDRKGDSNRELYDTEVYVVLGMDIYLL